MPRSLEDIQDDILSRVQAGEPVDRASVLSEHPAHAEALLRFFNVLDAIETPPPARDADNPSRLGEFRIVRELGRGGMGIVYEAEQTSLGRRVALKVLPNDLADQPRIVARFRREAESAGRLRHPNIVPVYSVGTANGAPFFAMEMVSGRSLEAVLAERTDGRDAGLPAAGAPWHRWVTELVARVADGLAYAHREGILHRDVKPGNILIEKDGTPRITDFGLALDLGQPGLTSAGETFGTPLYMSPEQALRRERPLDARTDVYSLGVTLYEALTLRPPYDGVTAAEVFAALRTGKIVRPSEVDRSIPEALEKIVVRALEHDPLARYPTASALAEDLRAVLDNRGLVVPAARHAPVAEAAAPTPTTRARAVAPWAIAAAAALAVGAALWAFLPGRERGGERDSGAAPGAPSGAAAPKRGGAAAAAIRVSAEQKAEAEHLGVPVSFENSIGMKFVLIPAGKFQMGSPPTEPGRRDDETQREVTISSAFYMQVTETTNAQWRKWNSAHTPATPVGISLSGDDVPATSMLPADIDRFAGWTSNQDGAKRYRLPTESEWEYACRAGTSGPWYWPGDIAPAAAHENLGDLAARRKHPDWFVSPIDDGFADPAPVASFLPNPWGLYDMLGNVMEWCADADVASPGGPSGRANAKSTDPSTRIARGGGFDAQPSESRAASRHAFPANSVYFDTGLRLVAELPVKMPRTIEIRVSDTQKAEAERLGVPVSFENAAGMQFVLVPAGKFTMGSPPTEPGREDSETQHEVTFTRPLYVQVTELTWGQFRRWDSSAWTDAIAGEKADTDDHPVMRLRPADLDTFVAWLHTSDPGHTYAVPTEAQWEYACRAGTTTSRYWGDDVREAPKYANAGDASWKKKSGEEVVIPGDDGFAITAPVASFLPNAWGLYDMLGNVSEWTADNERPLGSEPQIDPAAARVPDSKFRVIRGAGFHNHPRTIRCARRSFVEFGPDERFQDIGVRLVAELPKKAK